MILLVSGASGSGKTSACRIVARASGARDIPTGGVICDAVFEDGRKVGIQCADLARGDEGRPWPLARVRPGALPRKPGEAAGTAGGPATPAFDDSDPTVVRFGMWEFQKSGLAAADAAISGYVATLGVATLGVTRPGYRMPLVFVDEIGPLELDRGTGMVKTLAALDEAAPLGAPGALFLVVARPDIAARLAERWPGSLLIEMNGTGPESAAEAILAAHAAQAAR